MEQGYFAVEQRISGAWSPWQKRKGLADTQMCSRIGGDKEQGVLRMICVPGWESL